MNLLRNLKTSIGEFELKAAAMALVVAVALGMAISRPCHHQASPRLVHAQPSVSVSTTPLRTGFSDNRPAVTPATVDAFRTQTDGDIVRALVDYDRTIRK